MLSFIVIIGDIFKNQPFLHSNSNSYTSNSIALQLNLNVSNTIKVKLELELFLEFWIFPISLSVLKTPASRWK